MASSDHTVENIQQEVLELYEKAWKLEKESIKLGVRKHKSEIFLSREILEILIEIQDDYNNDGYSLSQKLKEKKIKQISKYILKLKTSKHIEMLTDFRNRNVILLLISIPCKQTINCINHLIKKFNCDIHCTDNEGHNGCHIACEYTNINALKLLYKYNVNIVLKDKSLQQLTPLHIAIDILISSENDANSINTYKYTKIVKLCTEYALLQGQDIVNDKIGKGNGQCWNFEVGESILDVAMKNISVLTVITEAYNNCRNLKKEFKKVVLNYNKSLNETMVDLIWLFMYCKLPKLKLNNKLKKLKHKLQNERIKRRESMRNSIRGKSCKKINKNALKKKKHSKINTQKEQNK